MRDKATGEVRDCLDQRWYLFGKALDYLLVPLSSSMPEMAIRAISDLGIEGIILSGGNSISAFDPKSPDISPVRDQFEASLIDAAVAADIAVLGVCRGMQMINWKFGGKLSRLDGHAGTRHRLIVLDRDDRGSLPEEVNSYHDWGISRTGLASGLIPLAVDLSGNIEAARHAKLKIAGMMWHPEREDQLSAADCAFIRGILK